MSKATCDIHLYNNKLIADQIRFYKYVQSESGTKLSLRVKEYKFQHTQSADSTVSSFVDSSAQHRGMRPNLIAMKNKNSQSQI